MSSSSIPAQSPIRRPSSVHTSTRSASAPSSSTASSRCATASTRALTAAAPSSGGVTGRGPSVLSQPILDNSPGGASRLAALLVAYILPVCALLAPCQPGAALRIIGNSWLGQDTRTLDGLRTLDGRSTKDQ